MNSIAIIMSVYKGDNFNDVKTALESLYDQSVDKIDIYVQEDGVVEKGVHKFLTNELALNKIAYLGLRNINKGLAFSLNELIKIVLGNNYNYIVRMDADDISTPIRIERQFIFMENNPQVDICGTYIEEFGDGINYKKKVTYPLKHKDMFEFFKKRTPLAHVSSFFRRSYFDKAGFYEVDGHISNEDTLMWMKGFASKCRFANINYVGVRVRVGKDFFSRRGGWKKTLSDFRNRMLVNKKMHYGFSAYIYAIALMVINLMPSLLKKYAYKYLRQ